jgi:hypothetical protein
MYTLIICPVTMVWLSSVFKHPGQPRLHREQRLAQIPGASE